MPSETMDTESIFDRLVDSHLELTIGIVVVALAFMIGVRRLGERPLVEQFPRLTAIADLVLMPLAVIVVGSLARVGFGSLGINELDEDVRALTVFATYIVATLVVARLIEVLLLTAGKEDDARKLTGLLRGLFYTGATVVGIAIYLRIQGAPLTGFAVSTGVAAALIGFALQRTLGDLFSGIALSVERPFRTGDWLRLPDGVEGQVIDINWRATRLRGWDNTTHVIPNGMLAGERFVNLHGPTYVYAPWYLVKLSAEVDPKVAKSLLLEAALKCSSVLKKPLPIVRIMDASTLPYTYMVWVHFANYPAMFVGREELFREVHYALKRAGIQVAPDIQEWHSREAYVSRSEPPNILSALKNQPIAADFSEQELELIASRAHYFHADAGTVLVREGENFDVFDIIASGVIEASLKMPDGSHRVLEELLPGRAYGIASMMTGEPAIFQFAAKTDVTLIRIGTNCLRPIVEANPKHAAALAQYVTESRERAAAVRAASARPVRKLGFHEILSRIEDSLAGK